MVTALNVTHAVVLGTESITVTNLNCKYNLRAHVFADNYSLQLGLDMSFVPRSFYVSSKLVNQKTDSTIKKRSKADYG